MARMLARQFALNLAVALLLVLAVLRLPRATTSQYAIAAATLGLAVSASVLVSSWNWYGFGATWTIVNTLDRTIGFGLMGLVVGALTNLWSGRRTTDEWDGVRAHAAMPSNVGSTRTGIRS